MGSIKPCGCYVGYYCEHGTSREQAEKVVHELLDMLGLGFHVDTPIEDYTIDGKPVEKAYIWQAKLNFAKDILGEEFDKIVLKRQKELMSKSKKKVE